MPRNHRLTICFGCAVFFLQMGCSSTGISNRIQEKATVFAELNAATQKHIQGGNVERGYTKDMVYIALGNPNKVTSRKAADESIEIWIYKNMILPNSGGFKGLTYNTGMDIGPGFSPQNGFMNASGGTTPDNQALYHATRNAATSGSQEQNSLNTDALASATELPDLPTGTLYVFFYENRVFKLVLDV